MLLGTLEPDISHRFHFMAVAFNELVPLNVSEVHTLRPAKSNTSIRMIVCDDGISWLTKNVTSVDAGLTLVCKSVIVGLRLLTTLNVIDSVEELFALSHTVNDNVCSPTSNSDKG